MHPHLSLALPAICLSLVLLTSDLSAQDSGQTIEASIAGLRHKDYSVRWASVTALARTGSAAVPALTKALRDIDQNVRANAALALGKIGAPAGDAVQDLISALKDSGAAVRENAAGALGNIGPPAAHAVDALLVCLSDRDPYVNGKAAEALSSIGSSAVPGLISTLSNGDPTAMWCVTIALSKMGPAAYPATEALTEALTNASDDVRWGAAIALGNIGARARSAIPALMNALSDPDQDVRMGASLALDHIDPGAVEAHTDWHSIAATIDSLTPGLMKETRVPGVSVALINKSALVWSRQFGAADAKSNLAVTNETMFEACSMTKPMFAYVVMKLAETGKIDLDRPLADYLDPSSLRGQPDHGRITARMVLSHTSGLPNWRKGEEERDGPLPVTFAPGSKFGYSGEGIYYLQKVFEKITCEPLDLYAQRTLLDPLKLEHTSFVWTEEFDTRIASGHDSAGAFLQKTRYTHPNAAYTLYTSANDYARFLIEIMNPNRSGEYSLTQRSVDTMLSHQVAVTSREPIERPGRAKASEVYWGLGWGINTTARGDIVHHSGSNRSGFRCFSQFCPATGSGIVIMANGTGGSDLWTRLISRIGNL